MEQKLHDIYDVWHVPFWQQSWFYWSIYILIGIVLLIIMSIIFKKYRSYKKIMYISPWDAALKALDTLNQEKIATEQEGERFYVAVTYILKKYLQERYSFTIASKTDDEVIVYLESIGFDPKLLEDIRSIFEGGVFIKFAQAQAIQEQIEKDFERSVAFIKSTIPVQKKK